MSWTILLGLVFALGLSLFAALTRRNDLRRMRQSVTTRERAIRQGSAEAQLQHPVVDLSRCLGCGTCVAVCPENGVLDLVHGQAVVVNGARCVGVSACERECPVDAITVTLSNVSSRDDIPAVGEDLEAIGSPGVFLAGEVTAHALIKTATEHGTAVAAEVARRLDADDARAATPTGDAFDLCIVGAGPAGIACALEARRLGLHAVCLEQEASIGGTVAKYPRRKLVLTQPVDLPLHGRLKRTAYSKEELIHLWRRVAVEHELPIRTGETFTGVSKTADGLHVVGTTSGKFVSRYVCLALGRRGMPRRLGIAGEELPKVAYSLMDANSYQDRRVLVVGGGDSAAEIAIALAEQPGNVVTMSYRKASFFRLKAQNEDRLSECISEGRIRVLFDSRVTAIQTDAVHISQERVAVDDVAPARVRTKVAAGPSDSNTWPENHRERHRTIALPNDDVFVMIGGTPMHALLERCGVSFDPALRDAPPPVVEQGTGLVRALTWGFAFAFLALVWAVFHVDYYSLSDAARTTHEKHDSLRPGLGIGLWLGITAALLIVVNLVYLLRKSATFPLRIGSLQMWMTSHVGTGVLAFLCALLHSAMAPGQSPGGHALWALAILLVTGAIGRYFYAYVPRAANGRELELTEVKSRLSRLSDEWEGLDNWDESHREFTDTAQAEVRTLVDKRQWSGSFVGRVLALIGMQRDLRQTLRRLEARAREVGLPADRKQATLRLTREAHRTALMVAHFEDLRSLLNTWRYLHRWVAAMLVLLVVVHIIHAMNYGAFTRGVAR